MPLAWSEIESWSLLHRIQLKPWELDILTMLDDVWLEVVRKATVSVEDLLPDNDDPDRKA